MGCNEISFDVIPIALMHPQFSLAGLQVTRFPSSLHLIVFSLQRLGVLFLDLVTAVIQRRQKGFNYIHYTLNQISISFHAILVVTVFLSIFFHPFDSFPSKSKGKLSANSVNNRINRSRFPFKLNGNKISAIHFERKSRSIYPIVHTVGGKVKNVGNQS